MLIVHDTRPEATGQILRNFVPSVSKEEKSLDFVLPLDLASVIHSQSTLLEKTA